MNQEFDRYKSITFIKYFIKNGGHSITIDYENRNLAIIDVNLNFIKKVHFSSKINYQFELSDLLKIDINESGKTYYVFEDGAKECDWLWYYDFISITQLFEE